MEEISQPSLEETIRQAEYNKIATAARQSKNRILEMLFKSSKEYSKIVERNNSLSKSHQITHEELELDPRITADLNRELDVEMSAVRERLAFKVEKSELGLQKLLEHSVQPIRCLPFVICKILKPDDMVYSMRQHVLDTDNIMLHIDTVKLAHASDKQSNGNSSAESKMQYYEIERQEEEKIGEEIEIKKAKDQTITDIIKDINYEDMDSSLAIQLNHIIRKYTSRKTRLEEREKKVNIILQ